MWTLRNEIVTIIKRLQTHPLLLSGFFEYVAERHNVINGTGHPQLFYAACIWVTAMLIVLYHRAGIQVIGASIALIGFIAMLMDSRFFLALSLFAVGLMVHGCGRLLLHLKRRQ